MYIGRLHTVNNIEYYFILTCETFYKTKLIAVYWDLLYAVIHVKSMVDNILYINLGK